MREFKDEIDFDNVLFHGLTHYETGNIRIKLGLQRLINILRSNAILSRKEIYNTFGDKYYRKRQDNFCRVNWNGVNNVSVCQKNSMINKKQSEAFRLFVENSISLILDKNLLKELEVVTGGQLEDGEYQIKDKIDLKYIKGIVLPTLNPTEVAIHKKEIKGYSRNQTEEWIQEYYNYCIDNVFKILNHFKIDLPVYSIRNGKIIKPIEEVLDDVYGKENNVNL